MDEQPDDEDHERDREQAYSFATARSGIALCGASLEIVRVARKDLDNIVDTALDAACKISRAEAWQDGMVDNEASDSVRQRSFQAVSHFNPYLALGRSDDEHRAIVLALLPNPPMASKLIAVVSDVVASQGA